MGSSLHLFPYRKPKWLVQGSQLPYYSRPIVGREIREWEWANSVLNGGGACKKHMIQLANLWGDREILIGQNPSVLYVDALSKAV